MNSQMNAKNICNKITEIAESKLSGKVDMGVSMVPKNGGEASKSLGFHCKCSVTLWKLALGVIGISVVACHICLLLRRKKCRDCQMGE